MRIISKYKDYYDNASMYGIDKDVVYERSFIDISDRDIDDFKSLDKFRWRLRIESSHYDKKSKSWVRLYTFKKNKIIEDSITKYGTLWFCGKGYNLIFSGQTKSFIGGSWHGKPREDSRVFSFVDNKKWYASPHVDGYKYIKENIFIENNRFNSRLSANDGHPEKIVESDFINLKFNSPSVFVHQHGVIVNPILRDIGFARIMPAHESFQEIQMYLMGALLSNKDTDPWPLTEKDQVRRHGMDKWSFRKMPKVK